MVELQDLIKELNELEVVGRKDILINNLTSDSREVGEGTLFVCLEGFTVDGHNFIQQAVDKGAVAVVVEKDVAVPEGITKIKVRDSRIALGSLANAFYDFPTRKLTLIGVTGTNGKTTTTHLIRAIIREWGEECGLVGTIANYIGDKQYPVKNTTPESIELHRLFKKMVDRGIKYAVMEVSSHALDLHRVDACDFDMGIFTNLTQDHLDYHRTLDEYLKAKGKLFSMLGNEKGKMAIVNADDQSHRYIEEVSSAPIQTYGIENEADVKGFNLDIKPWGISYDVKTPVGNAVIKLGITAKFNAYNSLAALAACLSLGIDLGTIKAALEKVKGVPGRFEAVNEGQKFPVIVDYAHTPDSLENILQTAREFTKGKVIIVFGCGGDRDRTKRPIMGRVAAHYADYCFITSDNPRTEDPQAIINEVEQGVLEGGMGKQQYETILNRREAIEKAILMAAKDDIVLIAGKGHEDYQIIGKTKNHFDDREVAREVLKGING